MHGDTLSTNYVSFSELVPYLEVGDLIEIKRTMLVAGSDIPVYTHWALFIGGLDPRVIHKSTGENDFVNVTGEDRIKDSFVIMKKFSGGSEAEVRCDKLKEVMGSDVARVNNQLDESHRPFPPPIILERALVKLGEQNYNIVFNNCEHFVKWCRYGNNISSQAVAAKSVILTSVLSSGFNPIIAVGAGALFAATSEKFSQYIHRTFGSNRGFSFF